MTGVCLRPTILLALHGCVLCLTVKTSVGDIFGLEETQTVDGRQYRMSKFLSIPFAESTAGENRFKKPISKASFRSRFDATKNLWRAFSLI
ncbi:hypothetical protein DPMN_004847 [Dreissena polymorpha]|uniref:Carboxylesterase type B domain-containing protein n=1 Tax=Dreissena polymorpha TaxID=45954 RepID=A0A9D4MP88_DREPO|nr:hypothetical protein DPMN_004847 [Dreissena polymorpha]